MMEWICHNRDVFLMNYVQIGHCYQVAKQLEEEHSCFTVSSMVNGTCLSYIHVLSTNGAHITHTCIKNI